MSTYLITGSTKGLGLEMVTQLSSRPTSQTATVIATSRSPKPSEALQKIIDASEGRVVYIPLDISSPSSITSAAQKAVEILPNGLEVLINNAATTEDKFTSKLEEMSELSTVLHTNVVSVHNVICAFLPLLRKGSRKLIVNVSSNLGSFGMHEKIPQLGKAPMPCYKISKAALNMLTLQWANSLEDEKFIVVAANPGRLKTTMNAVGTPELEVDVGAAALLKNVDSWTLEESGQFRNIEVEGWDKYDGGKIAW